jgi:hypothetical protein
MPESFVVDIADSLLGKLACVMKTLRVSAESLNSAYFSSCNSVLQNRFEDNGKVSGVLNDFQKRIMYTALTLHAYQTCLPKSQHIPC